MNEHFSDHPSRRQWLRQSFVAGTLAVALRGSTTTHGANQQTIGQDSDSPNSQSLAVFPKTEFTVPIQFPHDAPAGSRLHWNWTIADRPLAAGDIELNAETAEIRRESKPESTEPKTENSAVSPNHLLKLTSPDLADGLIRESVLKMTWSHQPRIRPESRSIWIMSRLPFLNQQVWLKSLPVVLLDPKGTLTPELSRSGLAHQAITRIEQLAAIEGGVVLIPDGLDQRQVRSACQVLTGLVQRKVSIVWFAPYKFEWADPLMLNDSQIDADPPIEQQSWKGDFVAHIDRRISQRTWQPTPLTQTFRISLTKSGPIWISEPTTRGWSAIEYRWPHSRLIVIGCPLAPQWETDPAPRYLLKGLIARCVPQDDTKSRS